MLEGKTLINEPLSVRIDVMKDIPNQAVRTTGDFKAFYSQAIALGFEGIMIKILKQRMIRVKGLNIGSNINHLKLI